MSQLDYQDWNRVDQWIGNPFVQERGVNHSNLTTFGPFFMGPWAALSVLLTAFPAGLPLMVHRVDWWQDQAVTQLIAEQTLQGRAGVPLAHCLPALGPWVTVTFQPGGANINSNVTLQPRRDLRARCSPFDDLAVLRFTDVAVGPAATVVLTPTTFTAGKAHLNTISSASNWFATVRLVDSTGARQGVCAQAYRTVLGALATSSLVMCEDVEFSLPAQPWQLEVANVDLVGVAFSGSVVMDSSW